MEYMAPLPDRPTLLPNDRLFGCGEVVLSSQCSIQYSKTKVTEVAFCFSLSFGLSPTQKRPRQPIAGRSRAIRSLGLADD